MKRALALGLAIFLGSSAIVTYHGADPASASTSATPPTIALDCTNATTLASSSSVDPLGANRLITGRVGYTFTITNSTATQMGDTECDVYKAPSVFERVTGGSDQNDHWVVQSTTNANSEDFKTLTLKVVGSGTFIVKTGAGTGAVTFNVNACDLDGSGIAADPWLVGSAADFQKVGFTDTGVGDSSCGLSGHYLQTAHLDSSGTGILSNYSEDRVTGEFTGTYDGDHYRISLGGSDSAGWNYNGPGDNGSFSERLSLFEAVNGGTIKRVRVSGNIKSSSDLLGGIVGTLSGGGVISEVSSSVVISSNNNNPSLGGIVGQTGDGAARVQYSRSTSNISWVPANTPTAAVNIGGIIGLIPQSGSAAVREVRDSYYTGDIAIDSTKHSNSDTIYLGGIIGAEADAPGVLVRTYSVGSASDSCVSDCADSEPDLRAGALIGNGRSDSVFVSNFFLRSGLFQAAVGSATAPDIYNGSNEPVAVPLSATRLKQIATYTTLKDGSTNGPGGGEMAASSHFRWAIEGIGAATFVPSNYDVGAAGGISDYTNRIFYPDPENEVKEYRVLRGGDLSAHNVAGTAGIDPASVVGYPALGRVWDICDDYPTLVWENVNSCGGGGGSGGTTTSSKDTSPSTADLAAAAGLSEAEYAAFLASGLTLEQFLASRLAATGPSSPAIVGGISAAGALVLLGGSLLIASRARRTTAHR